MFEKLRRQFPHRREITDPSADSGPSPGERATQCEGVLEFAGFLDREPAGSNGLIREALDPRCRPSRFDCPAAPIEGVKTAPILVKSEHQLN